MIVVLTALWLLSLGGDPPPSLASLAIINTIFFLLVEAWAYWMNRIRPARSKMAREGVTV
jgi:hypothetical protein